MKAPHYWFWLLLFLFSPKAIGSAGADIHITGRPAIEAPSDVGYQEWEISIRNRSAKTLTGRAEGSSENCLSSHRLQIGPREEKTWRLVTESPVTSSLHVRVGTVSEGVYASEQNRGVRSSIAGFSPGFAGLRQEVEELHQKTTKSRDRLSRINFFPDDWRALVGLNLILMKREEWRDATPAQKRALRHWVAEGGQLIVEDEADWSVFGPRQPGNSYGFGHYETRPAAKLTAGNVYKALNTLTPPRENRRSLAIGQRAVVSTSSQVDLAGPESSWALMVGFVVVFAIVIGPVNLLWLAPANRRWRLFVTTPLLSLGASLLLIVVILIGDGLGGVGTRFVIHQLFPYQHEEMIYQMQSVRTGLLLKNRFELREPVYFQRIFPSGSDRGMRNVGDGVRFDGDWFGSRSLRSYELALARPTRAGITLAGTGGDGAPMILSSIAAPLKAFFLIDEEGRFWEGENVLTGRKQTLRPSSREALVRSLNAEAYRAIGPKSFAHFAYQKLILHGLRPGFFFGISHEPEMIETLPELDWKENVAVYYGPFLTASLNAEAREVAP